MKSEKTNHIVHAKGANVALKGKVGAVNNFYALLH